MLINKPKYEVDEVITLRLITTEEIIARFVRETDTGFVVTKPLALMPTPQGITMTQMVMTVEINTEVEIQKQHVVVHGPTRQEAADGYLEATTGIKPVRGKLLNAAGMQAR